MRNMAMKQIVKQVMNFIPEILKKEKEFEF